MIKILSLLISIVLCASNLFAQSIIDFDTTILVGKEKQIYDYRTIVVDKYNNKYVAGFFKGAITINNTTLYTNSPSLYDYSKGLFVVKYDSLNSFLWAKKIAESDTTSIFSLVVDNSGEYTVAINFNGKIFYENDSVLSKGDGDIIMIKYDASNSVIYKIQIGGVNGEGITNNSLTIDSNNHVYITGVYNSTWTNNYPNYKLGFGNDTIIANTQDAFIAKYDPSGNPLWCKSFGSIGIDGLNDIKYFQNNLFIMGVSDAHNNNDICGITLNYPIDYYSMGYIAKLDTMGNGLWAKRFGTSDIPGGFGYVMPKSLCVTNNRIFFTGNAWSNNQNVFLFDGGPTLYGSGADTDYFISSYDLSGNFQWNTVAKSPYSEYLTQLAADNNSNLYGVGAMEFSSYFPTDTLYSNGSDDVLVCSYDSSGNFRWAIHGGGAGADIGSGIALNMQTKPYIVGGTTSDNGCFMGSDTLYPPSSQSTLFYASLDSIDNIATNLSSDFAQTDYPLQIFPNPADDEIFLKINISLDGSDKLTILNSVGQVIDIYSVSSQVLTLTSSSFSSGVYFVNFKNSRQTISQKLIIHH